MNHSLEKLFRRDLKALAEEISRFKDEDQLWKTPHGIPNSAGNLTLHICGNLKHYIGAVIGKINYTRDREKEFSEKGLSTEELVADVEKTCRIVLVVLQGITTYDLKKTYPKSLWNEAFSTEFFLIHLHSHLNYHLGQINYLRRILEGQPA